MKLKSQVSLIKNLTQCPQEIAKIHRPELLLISLLLLITQYSFAQVENSAPSDTDNYKQFLHLNYDVIDSLTYIEYSKGAFDKAIPYMQAGREKAKNDFGEQDSVFAEYTNNLGFFFQELGQYDKALPMFIQAKDILKKVFGKDDLSFASSLNNLALLHRIMGNFDKALPLFIQAKDIFERRLGMDHPHFAASINNLAMLHYSMGNFDKALPLYLQAKDIVKRTLDKDHPNIASSLNNLALLYKTIGNYDKALSYYIQAKDIYKKSLGEDDPQFANALNNLAILHEIMGNFDKALPLNIQAKDIYKKALGEDHSKFATSLSNLANLYTTMGNFNKALPLYIQAKDIFEKSLGKDHPDFAPSLIGLANLYTDMGNFNKALPLYSQAKDILKKALGKDHPDFASSLNNLASLHKNMGDFDKALPLYRQAIEIDKKGLGKDHPDLAGSLNNLADLHQKMGNFDKAWDVLGQAMNSSSTLPLNHNFDRPWQDSLRDISYPSNAHVEKMVESLEYVYSLLEKDPRVQEAISKQMIVADLAATLLSKLRKHVSNEKDKLRILSYSNDWLQRSLNVFNPKEHGHRAFNLSDENKSVLLLQATKSEQAYRLGELPDSLVWEDKKLLKKQSQLQAKLIEKRPKSEKDSLRIELNKVNQNIDDFEEFVKKEYPKYHKLKYQQVDTKVENIQALLAPNTALLEYVIGDSVVHIFYVDKHKVEWAKTYVSNKQLSDNIQALHQSLSNYTLLTKDKKRAYESYTAMAYWFYQKIIQPALIDKQDLYNLLIVTDGQLGHLPFETFLVEPAPQSVTDYHQLHYLVSDYNISYNYSATLWKENMEVVTPNNNGQMLGMAANYDIKLDSATMDVRLPTDQWMRELLNPLPAARKEVETLQNNFKGFFAFDGLASEKTIKKMAPEYAIIHLAMHGILDNKRPVLSSLAFTEDNDSIESNFWQAYEISKIQLNVDLVVLSACETGFGKFEKGNGIASLARAFMYAGSPALIVSLWQVNDFATSQIMKNLYDNLANGMKKNEALRQAKLQFMKSSQGVLAHPAFWSPFILIGNESPISISKKGGYMYWAIGGGILLLVIAVFVLRRQKREAA